MAALGMAEVPRVGSEAPSLIERNGTMLNANPHQSIIYILSKGLWLRLIEGLANRLEKRRAQTELALRIPRERLDLAAAVHNMPL
jgi:hypothetical protein